MTTLAIGCAQLPSIAEAAAYFAKIPYAETDALATRPPKPKAWHQLVDAGKRGALGVVAPAVLTHNHRSDAANASARGYGIPDAAKASLGHLADHALARELVAAFAERAAALAAPVVMFATPPDFTPNATNRARIERFFGEVATAALFGAARRVWRPDGLWEPSTVIAAANAAGVTPSLDPLALAPGEQIEAFAALPLAHAYFRVAGFGSRGRLRPGNVETLVALAGAYPSAHLVFATETALSDARNAIALGQ